MNGIHPMFLEAEPCFTNFHCLPPTQGLEGTTLRTHEELAACLESTSYRALGSPALASYSLPSRGDNSSCPWKTHLHRFQPACLCGTSPFPFVQPFKHWKEPMSERFGSVWLRTIRISLWFPFLPGLCLREHLVMVVGLMFQSLS